MATFLFAVLVTMLPWYEEQATQAAPSKAKVFLAEFRDPRVQKECFGALATALTAGLAESKYAVPARSAGDADVVVQVKECRTAAAPQLGGDLTLSASTGGRGRVVQAGASVAAQITTVGRVVLVVDDRGKPREFATDANDLPLPETARNATASLLAWIKTAHAS
jgi:hypothetical protein